MRLESQNVAVAKRIWAAAASGDADALERVLAEDVVWRVPGRNPLAGTYHGRERVVAQIAHFANYVDDLRLDLQDIFVSARGAVIHYDMWARRGEMVLETDIQLRLRIEDGQIRECQVVPSDVYRNDEFLNWAH